MQVYFMCSLIVTQTKPDLIKYRLSVEVLVCNDLAVELIGNSVNSEVYDNFDQLSPM